MEKNNLIKILPDFIANQIAAGEVVQRPESVVKELIENSLDAGATEIAIVIKAAGKQLIHIVDNGSGLTKDDLELSIKRHATSKIISQEDLEEIHTYGFRGEALASIASIATLEIRTRQKGEEHGWKLFSEPMKEARIEPCNMDYGTQVFVKNLFYNVPARKKFLKSDITEFRYISDTMIKFAISRPEIRFAFYDNDSLIFDVKPENPVKRIEDVLGKNIANALIPVEFANDMVKISGFIGEPLIAKQTKTGQYLFLNNRSIISKSIGYAVYSAFEHLLEKRMQPFFYINITLDPKIVDVNVHPQKHEVKFEDERYIYNILNKAVNDSLQKRNLIPEINTIGVEARAPFERISSGSEGNDFMVVNKVTGEVIEPDLSNYRRQTTDNFHRSYPAREDIFPQKPQNVNFEISAFDAIFGKKDNVETIGGEQLQERHWEESEKPVQMFWQLHKKYIFTQSARGVMVIDQHAAHERILYEKAIKAMNREFGYSQDLLFPVIVKLNSSQKLLIKELENDLRYLGFIFESKAEDTAEIKAVPLDIPAGTEGNSLLEVLSQYEEYDRIRESTDRDNLAASFACKAAIKTGKYLTQDEMKKLVNDLFECAMPYVCPHGRPVIIEFTLQEFDRRFGRI